MSKTGWIIFTAVVLAVLGGLVAWARISNPPVNVDGIDHSKVVAASAENGNIGDHVRGKKDSKVLLIEYGDFQCPGCAEVHPQTKQIIEEYGDRIGFVFRNFPLSSIHPNARLAAAAAEAAGLQGKYWEMHDLIYDNQSDWSSLTGEKRNDIFVNYAKSLELDIDKFNTDLASKSTGEAGQKLATKKINFDIALGKANGVSATPTFFINGTVVDDSVRESFVRGDLEPIKALLDEALKSAN